MRATAAVLLLGLATPALGVCSDWRSWSEFEIHTYFLHNNAKSVAAKNWVRTKFCKEFGPFTPSCAVGGFATNGINITEDFGVTVQKDNLLKTVSWFQQHRDGFVGSGMDLNVAINPISGCGVEADLRNYTLFVGERVPYNTNRLAKSVSPGSLQDSLGTAAVVTPPAATANSTWLYQCSDDCKDVCEKPYAFAGSTCSSESKGFHLHVYYVNNNPQSVVDKDSFHSAMGDAFDIPETVCPDTTGHEQPHPDACWLVGPQGTETQYPQDGQASSFVAGTHSLYVTTAKFNAFFPAILYYRNLYSMDFLFHPTFGCNFADHERWSLHGGYHWPNNKYGIAHAGDYKGDTPVSVDNQSPYHYPNPVDERSCMNVSSYLISVLLDSVDATSSANAERFHTAAAAFGLKGVKNEGAWGEAGSPYTASVYSYPLAHSDMPVVLPWILAQRGALGLDLVVSPVTATDGSCAAADFQFRSVVGGQKFQWNTDAFSAVSYAKPSLISGVPSGGLEVSSYVLYLMYGTNNKWQQQAVDGLVSDVASHFGLERKGCKGQYPTAEPSYVGLCLMEEEQRPYKEANSPLTMGYAGVFVPSGRVQEVLDFVLLRKTPLVAGYEVDTLLVPLTGSPAADYIRSSLYSGSAWRLNTAALQ
eukprot:Hpha_TRINITY_DN13358_c0_g1::TRINITY_DN13358_c0_g1_i2::g.95539::m.95539